MPHQAIATIAVHLDSRPQSAVAARYAAGLARRFDATLIGFAAEFPRPLIYGSGFGTAPDVIELEEVQIKADLETAGEAFKAATAEPGIKSEWRASVALPADTALGIANGADLIVFPAPDPRAPGDGYLTLALGDVIMALGRPVLLLPQGEPRAGLDTVVIGWKDTREARRAAADAMPFLEQAKTVHLAGVEEPGGDSELGGDIAGFLARHGITASPAMLKVDRGETPGSRLVRFAQENKADLLVGGAYGHSRFREWAFGGVTSEMLGGCPVACLLSH